jgi:hypothetical protein
MEENNRKNSTKSRQTNPNSLANLIPGNPNGGRRAIPQEFKELAEKNSIPALEAAIAIMRNEDNKTADRLKAIEIVLERGIGKPLQSIDLESKNDSVIRIIMDGDLESWAK